MLVLDADAISRVPLALQMATCKAINDAMGEVRKRMTLKYQVEFPVPPEKKK